MIKDKLDEIISPDQLPVRLTGTNPRDIPEGGPVGETPVKLRTKVNGYIDVPRSGAHVCIPQQIQTFYFYSIFNLIFNLIRYRKLFINLNKGM